MDWWVETNEPTRPKGSTKVRNFLNIPSPSSRIMIDLTKGDMSSKDDLLDLMTVTTDSPTKIKDQENREYVREQPTWKLVDQNPTESARERQLNLYTEEVENRVQTGNDLNLDLLVAIDFGNYFTKVSYIFLPHVEGDYSDLHKIVVVRSWQGNCSEKAPSVLSYRTYPPIWGARVRPNDPFRVSYFKQGLENQREPRPLDTNESPSYITDLNWFHPLLPGKTSVDYTADYISAVVDDLLKGSLQRHFGQGFLKRGQISYVMTVPSNWSEQAKERFRSAVGSCPHIPRNRFNLKTDTEAMAMYCCYQGFGMLEDGEWILLLEAGRYNVVWLHRNLKVLN